MDQNGFQPLGIPLRGGGSAQCIPPAAGPLEVLPTRARRGRPRDGFVRLGRFAPNLRLFGMADLFKVVNDLANDNVLLTSTQKDEMFKNCLGWDCAVWSACPDPYACKNGSLGRDWS